MNIKIRTSFATLFFVLFLFTPLLYADESYANKSPAVNSSTSPIEADTENSGATTKAIEVTGSSAAMKPETVEPKESWPVIYREQVAFTFSTSTTQKKGGERAREAAQALTYAIEADSPQKADSETVDAVISGSTATIHVRGYTVTILYDDDAKAAGYANLHDYSEHITTLLNEFVPKQRKKAYLQDLFTHIFLSIFFALLCFLVLNQIKKTFDKLDHVLDENKEQIQPLSVMHETLLNEEAVGGFLALGLALGRILSYLAVVLTTLAAILGQFALTRNFLYEILAGGLSQFFKGFESLAAFIPRLVLALILIVISSILFKILDLFLKGISTGRIQRSFIPKYRIRAFRFISKTIMSFVLSTLILAALFGDFHNPFEILLIIMAGIFSVSYLPTLFNRASGVIIIWRAKIKVGDWMEIGPHHGEVAHLDLDEISLRTPQNGSIKVPMMKAAFQPYLIDSHRNFQIRLQLSSLKNLDMTIQMLESLFDKKHHAKIELIKMEKSHYQFQIVLKLNATDISQEVLRNFISKIDQQTASFENYSIELKSGSSQT